MEKIYELIKFPRFYTRERNEHKMFEVVKAILYREENHCSWKSLPQEFISWSHAYYYCKLLEDEGRLDNIFCFLYPPQVAQAMDAKKQLVEYGEKFLT
jgi:hypothetical protein